ncbi:MAG: MMPL family transporter [Acidimicrobiia bacterium]|nr:MMPL family transporter [Acidimicrobiia bacterium]
MLARFGRWCAVHRRIVIIAWVAVLVLVGAASGAVGSGFRSQFDLPDSESTRGFDIIEDRFGGEGGGQTGALVFRAEQGVEDPEVKTAMTTLFDEVAQFPDVRVTSPYTPEGATQIVEQGPEAGQIAYARIEVPQDIDFEEALAVGKDIRAAAPQIDGLQVELGGAIFAEFEPPQSEVLGLAFAIIILILAFGSVLAMGLPIGTAIAGIGLGAAVVTLLSNVMSMPDFATTLGIMIGLGVGIDYALFIVTRYRECAHLGMSVPDAVAKAMDTAGRAVIFAGITVVISLSGMLVMGVAFISGLGVGAAVTVALTMIAAITLLPALLSLAGPRVEVTRWRGIIAAGFVAVALVGLGLGVEPLLVGLPLALVVLLAGFAVAPLRREVPRRAPRPLDRTLAYRWSRLIQRRPWPAAIGGVVVLCILAIPVFSLRLGFSDEGNYPAETSTRKAYDLLAQGFGPGFNGPFVLAAELPPGTAPEALGAVTDALAATDGVVVATPPVLDDPSAPTAAMWRVIPSTAPQDEATSQLVERLRDDVLPAATAGSGLAVEVTGAVAAQIDFSNYLAARIPLFFGVVLALSFLLLMSVFRSVLVPLKAVVMNLLSIGAAYGVVIAVFQWGWLADLVGVGEGAPIEPFIPMMMFAIVFGLSMDYEVFLLSRIKEEYDRTRDNGRAVADGLAATARVITAAAAIMVFVFGSFLLESDRIIKLFGLGLSFAVLLDATVVRMLLVPATMELLGDRNWWLPRWLDRALPRIDVEGTSVHGPDEGEQGEEAPLPVGAGRS